MTQHYDRYTSEDQLVWKTLYEQQIYQLTIYASEEYIKGMQLCKFSKDRIPDIDELNSVLLSATGWTIEIVPGLIDNFLFFKLLSEKRFPASTWMRKMESLDYLEEPGSPALAVLLQSGFQVARPPDVVPAVSVLAGEVQEVDSADHYRPPVM